MVASHFRFDDAGAIIVSTAGERQRPMAGVGAERGGGIWRAE